jgi:hypothetical protein
MSKLPLLEKTYNKQHNPKWPKYVSGKSFLADTLYEQGYWGSHDSVFDDRGLFAAQNAAAKPKEQLNEGQLRQQFAQWYEEENRTRKEARAAARAAAGPNVVEPDRILEGPPMPPPMPPPPPPPKASKKATKTATKKQGVVPKSPGFGEIANEIKGGAFKLRPTVKMPPPKPKVARPFIEELMKRTSKTPKGSPKVSAPPTPKTPLVSNVNLTPEQLEDRKYAGAMFDDDEPPKSPTKTKGPKVEIPESPVGVATVEAIEWNNDLRKRRMDLGGEDIVDDFTVKKGRAKGQSAKQAFKSDREYMTYDNDLPTTQEVSLAKTIPFPWSEVPGRKETLTPFFLAGGKGLVKAAYKPDTMYQYLKKIAGENGKIMVEGIKNGKVVQQDLEKKVAARKSYKGGGGKLEATIKYWAQQQKPANITVIHGDKQDFFYLYARPIPTSRLRPASNNNAKK